MKQKILIIALILLSKNILSQEFATRLYTPKDGLVQAQVYCVTQGPKGYLWIGTLGGISRFDGVEFKNFNDADGLSSYAIYDMHWYNDTLFILTKEGVDILVNNKVYNYFYDPTINFMVGRMKITPKHRYVTGHNYGYSFYLDLNTKKVTRFPKKIQMKGYNNAVMTDSSFLIKKDNAVYEMLYGDSTYKKLYEFNENIEEISNYDNIFFVHFKSSKIKIYKKGNIIKTTRFGRGIPGSKNDSIYSVFLTQSGRVFYTNGHGGLYYLDGRQIIKISGNYNYILKLFEDREGTVWVSTEKGLLKIFTGKFKYYSSVQGYVDNVWAVAGFNDSLILMASYNQGIHVYCNGQEKRFSGDSGQYRACYFGVTKGFKNDLLISVFPGVARYDIDNNRLSTIKENLEDNNYTLIKDTANNRVLVASLHSVVAIYPDYSTEKLFDLTSINIYQFVTSLAVRDNKILVGLSKGLMELNPKSKSKTIRYVSNDKIRYVSMVTDKHNTVWAATSRGLLKIVGDSLEFLIPNNSNEDFTAAFINNNMLYAVSSTKLFLIDLEKYYNGKNDYLKYYGPYDGYDGDSPQQDAFYKDESGNLWFPTGYHVINMNMDELSKPVNQPEAFITSFMVSTGDTSFKKIDLQGKIEVNASMNNIVINYKSINLLNPERTQYQTLLTEGKRQWKSETKAREIKFNNLSPGKYTFTVKASVTGKFENAVPAVLNFFILPPFWQTTWFIVLAIIVFVALMVLIVLYVKRREEKKNKGKMEVLTLKNQALTRQMDNHFIVNITSQIVLLYESNRIKEGNKFTRTFSRFLQQNLEFMRKETITLAEEIALIENYIFLETIHKDDFKYIKTIDKNVHPEQIDIPPLLIQPIVENAVKYGVKKNRSAENRIMLTIKEIPQGISITVEDNGPGFQAEQKESRQGNNVSMKIIRDRLNLLGGISSLNIVSNKNGTKVIINIQSKLT